MFWANGVEYPSTTHYIDIFLDNEKSYTINIAKFTNDGYIKGDDWDNVDAESFIKELKSGSEKANKERIKNGYATVEDITWHIKPSYNKELGYVFYSLLVKFNDGSETYNSTAMVLGRKGYTDITFLFKDTIANVMPTEIDKVVKNFKYNQGSQYTDFKSGDKIAAYGVGALVAGSLGIKGSSPGTVTADGSTATGFLVDGNMTNKSIVLKFSNLDTSFKYLRDATLASTAGMGANVEGGRLLVEIPITNDVEYYAFGEYNDTTTTFLPLDELTVDRKVFTKAKSINKKEYFGK